MREHPCPLASVSYGLLPKFPFAHRKEFLTILEFALLQIQNSPCGLRHWICNRFASLRMVSQNSLMIAPGNQGNNRFQNDLMGSQAENTYPFQPILGTAVMRWCSAAV